MIPSTKKDERWQNLNMFPITALLFGFSIANLGLSTSDFIVRMDIFPLVSLCVSGVTVIHSFIDLLVMPRGRLDPIYVTIISCFLLIIWIGMFLCGVLEIGYYALSNSCYSYNWYTGEGHTSCSMLRSRLAVTTITMILYFVSVIVGAISLKRYQRLGLTRQQQPVNSSNLEMHSESKNGFVV